MILTFLLTYKLTDYAANFNTIKKESRIEIIFLALFFIFLFVPMSHINQGKIAINENRYLAKWKPLIKESGVINFNFGKDYSKWFNDRFNLRRCLTNFHTKITILLTGTAEGGFIDKNGFIYMDSEINHDPLEGMEEKDFKALIKFNDYFKKKNIELYVLVIPYKGNIIYPPTKKILIKDEYDKIIDKAINQLRENYDINIINPIMAMKEESENNYVYFKTEHHWTDDGAFVGYKELMKEITKNHPDIPVLKEEDFNISFNKKIRGDWRRKFVWGESTTRTNIPLFYKKKLHNTDYRYYTHKNSNLLKTKIIDIPYKKMKYYHYPEGTDYRVVLLGTSMSENLTEFIPYTFKNVLRLRNNSVQNISGKEEFKIMKYYKKDILGYNPDIIIFCISYRNIHQLRDLFKTK